MRRSGLVVLIVCSALLISRVMGLHVHLGHPGAAHGPAASESDHHHGAIASEFDDHHAAGHLQHGAVDASGQDMTPGKLPSLLLAALLATAFVLLLPRLFQAIRPHPDWPRPRRRRPRFLPPSQAPPLAS